MWLLRVKLHLKQLELLLSREQFLHDFIMVFVFVVVLLQNALIPLRPLIRRSDVIESRVKVVL